MYGRNGTYLSMVPGGIVTLDGANSYAGPTTVFPGTLIVRKAAGLYNADAAKWTAANIIIHKAATLRLNVGGPGEFTGEQIGTLLGKLTRSVNDNGLMGGSFLSLDTAKATQSVTISANLADSKGPGGGSFLFRKCGPGIIELSGDNVYTGQTILESGTLIVSSLNNSTSGPTTVSAGTLSLAHEKSLGENTEVAIQDGATLELDFNGQIQVRKLTLDGRSQSPGRYHAKNASGLIKGTGILNVLP
jgi:autotransporter-associated beta strand protein